MQTTTFQRRALKKADSKDGWKPDNKASEKRAFGLLMMGLLRTHEDGRYVITEAGRAALE